MGFELVLFLVILQGCLQNALAQIATYDIELGNLLKMQRGLGWPHVLNVVENHEALLKLGSSLVNQDSCSVTTPLGLTFDVDHPPNNRYHKWGHECGVRVRNITKFDEGRWRLTAVAGTNSITGWTEVYVEDDIESYVTSPISLHDGQTHAQIELTSIENSYCLVAQPFTQSSLVPGHCSITLERTTRAVQGNWNVQLGIPGRVSELSVSRHVAVEAERLDVGYLQDTQNQKLHLYCNILHTDKNITFCRFQKTSSTSGFNVIDGLSDGSHSYYGDGFAEKHCGMTVEHMTSADFGTWRCSVGVQEWAGNHIEQRTPMQALINVIHTDTRDKRIVRSLRENSENRTIFVQVDSTFTITCSAETSLMYCWFQHPDGSQYTPVNRVSDTQQFWYTGESLQIGDCGITFTHATDSETGEWTCHMGPSNQLGVEITNRVNVRVTGPLAAHETEIETALGQSVVLLCHSSNGNRPLKYCRFRTPTFVGMSIDETVTAENAILNRYYFTPERSLDYGDCSLTIISIQEEDLGEWTCAALVDEETLESRDTIMVVTMDGNGNGTEAGAPLSQAGIIGMVVGLALLLVVLAGYVWYRQGLPMPWRRTGTSTTEPVIQYDRQISSLGTGRSSLGSDRSSLGSDRSSNESVDGSIIIQYSAR